MRPTPRQPAQFEREGHLFLPGLFSPVEHRVAEGTGRIDDPVPQLRGACVHQQPPARVPSDPPVDRPRRDGLPAGARPASPIPIGQVKAAA